MLLLNYIDVARAKFSFLDALQRDTMIKKYFYFFFIPLISVLFLSLSFPSEALKGKHSADKRYVDHEDGTIIDSRTDLMWTKEDSYADLGKCLDWDASWNYVRGLTTGGYADWRLPTVRELETIYEKSKINKDYFGDTTHSDPIFASGGAHSYWSSETAGSCCARYVYFTNGDVNEGFQSTCRYKGVRAIRHPINGNNTNGEILSEKN